MKIYDKDLGMSRPLRLGYPDAWYHVMNRGRRDEEIFTDKQDYGGLLRFSMKLRGYGNCVADSCFLFDGQSCFMLSST